MTLYRDARILLLAHKCRGWASDTSSDVELKTVFRQRCVIKKGRVMQGLPTKIIALGCLLCVVAVGQADDTLATLESIKVDVLSQSTTMWNGALLPPYSDGQPEVSVVKITIPPGMRLPLHEHPYATAGVLLQGHLEVRTPRGDRTELKAGEALIELVNQPHAGANIGDEAAVILVVYAGIKGGPVTRLLEGDTSNHVPL